MADGGNRAFLMEHNNRARAQSIKELYEGDEVTSIIMNHPSLLLRKKSALYPEGRTSYRFKRYLRHKVTVIGKSQFKVSADDDKEDDGNKDGSQQQVQQPNVQADLQRPQDMMNTLGLGMKKKKKKMKMKMMKMKSKT